MRIGICFVITFTVVIFLLSFCFVSAEEINLPKAPEGFSWQLCPSIKAGFLVPDGWFFKEEEQQGTKAFFISKESIDQNVIFKTGLSVNVFSKSSVKTGMMPSLYAKKFIMTMNSMVPSDKIQAIGDGVYFKGFGTISISKPAGAEAVKQYTLAMGNDISDTLYIFVFESPESEWDQAWEKGSVIIDNLALDTEY